MCGQATEQVLAEAEERAAVPGSARGGFSTVKLEDPELARTSPSMLTMAQSIDLISFAAAIAQVPTLRPRPLR